MSEVKGTQLPFDARAALRYLRRADPRMATLIGRVGPLRLELSPARSPFETLLRAITHQQLSGKAAATIHGRLLQLFNGAPTPARLLGMPETVLRRTGLSRNKLRAVRDLASRTLDGSVPDFTALAGMSDAEVITRLTAVRGVGRWTAEMLLIFTLGRPDVLPLDDLGIRKGFRLVYGMRRLPALVTVRRAGQCWIPYRSVASWYLWRAVDRN
ncbi:MAG: DNA-3-methyladenine glycosylase 2 family protein [Gammaproteobacteria bacterium]|nr:DNA-3-methyladenine glycosylase 2 family protein [Gammaproteobacteria bacterium]